MAAVNVPDSRDNSLTPPLPEKSNSGKGAQRKTRQGIARNSTPAPAHAPAPASPVTNKQTADQAFHDASSEISRIVNCKMKWQIWNVKSWRPRKRRYRSNSELSPRPITLYLLRKTLSQNREEQGILTLGYSTNMKVGNLILFPSCASIGRWISSIFKTSKGISSSWKIL